MGTFPLLFLIFCRQHSFPRKQFWLYIPFLLLFILHSDPTLMAGSRGLRWPPPTSPPLPSPSSPHIPPSSPPTHISLPPTQLLPLPPTTPQPTKNVRRYKSLSSMLSILHLPQTNCCTRWSIQSLLALTGALYNLMNLMNSQLRRTPATKMYDMWLCSSHNAWKVELNYNFMKKS